MTIFSSQIDKRKKLDRYSLEQEMRDGSKRMGLKYGSRLPQTDNQAIRQVLEALKITDYELEDDELVSFEKQLVSIVQSRGVMMREVKLRDNWWKESSGPILGRTQKGHLVALLPKWTGRSYFYTAEDGSRQEVDRRQMEEVLMPHGYVFTKALPLRKLKKRDLIVFIWQSASGHSLAHMFIAALLVVLLGMFVPMANNQIFDSVIPAGDPSDLSPIAGLLIGSAVSMVLITYIRNLYIIREENIVEMNLQNAVMSRLFFLPPKFFSTHSSGELTSKMNNLAMLCKQINETIVGALLGSLLSVIYFVQVWIYGGKLIWPAMALFVLQALFIALYYRVVAHVRRLYVGKNDQITGMECNLFAGIQKIKLTGSETRAFTQWLIRYTHAARIIYNPWFQTRIYPSLLAFLNVGGLLVIYFFAVRYSVPASSFIAFSSAYGMMTTALSDVALHIPEMAQVGPLLESVNPILEAEPEMAGKSLAVNELSGGIEISNLSFRYQEGMPLVLDDISLKIQPGEYVGIVGKSGCGKSTLLRLLLGFETPLRGSIYYDQFDLAKVNKSQLRRRIGTCLQNGSLFTGDIFHNITITAPWSTHEDAWEALRQAYLFDEVDALPMGLHTIITEGGGGFSGGQKQRILIARALIGKPNIIFFDEATSALDNISQKQVIDNLDKLHCTRLVIAHRLSTIKHCDRIIVLDQGKVVEEGKFEDLMKRKGLFYEMSQRQL